MSEKLYKSLAASIGNIDRVRCATCGRFESVDAAECFKRGWPTCCGATMGLVPPPTDAEKEALGQRRLPL